jgi:hypothetical protein
LGIIRQIAVANDIAIRVDPVSVFAVDVDQATGNRLRLYPQAAGAQRAPVGIGLDVAQGDGQAALGSQPRLEP